MKKTTIALILAAAALLSACGAEDKTINGKTYQSFGLVDVKSKDSSPAAPR